MPCRNPQRHLSELGRETFEMLYGGFFWQEDSSANIPNEILIDVTNMGMEDVIHLSEIELPAGCTAVGDPDLVVVTVLTTKIEEVAPVAAAACY